MSVDPNGRGYIHTYTGKAFYPLYPKVEDICLRDIAHHLACVNRWTGAARRPISVAEHSVIVSERAEEIAIKASWPLGHASLVAKWGLLHDASEAYIADVASPLKHAPEMAAYRKAERLIMDVVLDWAELPAGQPPEVTQADRESLVSEANLLMQPMRPGWNLGLPVHLPLEPIGCDWRQAEELFLQRAHDLGIKDEYL